MAALALRDFEQRPAALGAVVTTGEDGRRSTLFLAPAGGGTYLAGRTVQVVTPRSPLGQALLGKRTGDEVEVSLAGKTRTLEIVDVA